MLQFYGEPAFVFHRTRALRMIATDLVRPFLGNLQCPLKNSQIEQIRARVRTLESFGQDQMNGLLARIENDHAWARAEDYLDWLHYVIHSSVSPCAIWTSYELAFEAWFARLRSGVDALQLTSSVKSVIELYSGYRQRSDPGQDSLGVFAKVAHAEARPLDSFDVRILDIHPPGEEDDFIGSPFESIRRSFAVVQFQSFLADVAATVDPQAVKNIEEFVRGTFQPTSRCRFCRIAELPGLKIAVSQKRKPL